MDKYIKLQDAIDAGLDFVDFYCENPDAAGAMIEHMESVPVADVVEVHTVIDRMNDERKRAKGNWHTDPYWLGWVDAMGRAQRIVDGTIDDEPMYGPSDDVCKQWPVYALNNEEDMREE